MNTEKQKAIEVAEMCCEIFPKLIESFDWFTIDNDNCGKDYIMPNIKRGIISYRVNHCPSCGAEVRGVRIPDRQFVWLLKS